MFVYQTLCLFGALEIAVIHCLRGHLLILIR